ncbi:glycosyltransferase family 2 protein [Leifsonia sp. 22587]|uniref:glycosyltransferase family 2 protein n=1 Tax=Leifsonia sp. 22587 TaxID=3453946 RepID=UPI003F8409C5
MRISVALCTHNGAAFIHEQVGSILRQTLPVDEIVLSDDASRDGTVAVVSSLIGEAGVGAPRLTVLRNSVPLGVVGNFEQAVSATDGDLVALCDQDDVWEPDRLRVLAAHFEKDPQLLCVFSDATIVDDTGTEVGATLFGRLQVGARELNAVRDGRAFDALLRRNLATGATMVFRRSLVERALPFPAEWIHDEWLAIIAASAGHIAVETAPLTRYRIHASNTIGVAEPSLGNRIRRVLEPRADRNAGLARRGAVLVGRLVAEGASDDVVRSARSKARFEARRARMPRNRLLRAVPVLLLALTGGYVRYASRGAMDVVRDLAQPA